jgi:hypothetical protein
MRRPKRSAVFSALKIAALVVASMVFLYPSCLAFHLTLEWDSNVDEDLAGYIMYYGTASRNYKYDVDIGDETSVTISGLIDGKKYYFAVTAYDIDGNESAYSAEIAYPNTGSSGASGGGGGGGCFISSAADGQRSRTLSLVFIGAILAGIFGIFLYHRPLPFDFAQGRSSRRVRKDIIFT